MGKLWRSAETLLQRSEVVSVTTDGGPATVGESGELWARKKEDNSDLSAYHCLIHQTVLCVTFSEHFAKVTNTTMKIINFLRASSSLQHRLPREFLFLVTWRVGLQFFRLGRLQVKRKGVVRLCLHFIYSILRFLFSLIWNEGLTFNLTAVMPTGVVAQLFSAAHFCTYR